MSLLIESSEQLRALTGSYYANNDFAKVEGDIEQATDELDWKRYWKASPSSWRTSDRPSNFSMESPQTFHGEFPNLPRRIGQPSTENFFTL